MVKGLRLRGHEKLALEALAGLVMDNILAIQRVMGVSYTSARRSVKSLEEAGLVWMIAAGHRGPKSPQTYMMTPHGYLAYVVHCDAWSSYQTHMCNSWVCPRILHQYGCYEEDPDLFRETAIRVLESYEPSVITRDNPEIIKAQRYRLDQLFIIQHQTHHPNRYRTLLKAVGNDMELTDIWRTYSFLEHVRRVDMRQAEQSLPHDESVSLTPSIIGRKYPGLPR